MSLMTSALMARLRFLLARPLLSLCSNPQQKTQVLTSPDSNDATFAYDRKIHHLTVKMYITVYLVMVTISTFGHDTVLYGCR